ncbi:MAG TPA: FAD-dependent monooxygenase [Rugosimonospora sp.]
MATALISGAGIAGTALAYWLHRHGFAVTTVERAPGLRPGGQAIDVRGAALDVVERMGILPEVRDLRTRMRGMSVLDGDGNEIMRSTEATFSSGRLDSPDVEILREDLNRLAYEQTREHVEYLFDDSITAIAQDADGARVEFERGASRTFDLVLGADGLHSTVRRLVFGPETDFLHPMNTYLAIFGMDNILGLDNWQLWMRDGHAGYAIYPVHDNTEIRVTLGFGGEPVEYDHRDTAQQKRIVTERLAGMGWETPRLLRGMADAPDFYFDEMAQVTMDRWWSGRVALLGDAAYCPSPLSGQGTSVALVAAYVLAQELARAGDDHEAGLARYEQRLRPFVAVNQALATENPGGPASEESIERAKHAIALD